METVNLDIGSTTTHSGGFYSEYLRTVEFQAEHLGSHSEPEIASGGGSPNRGSRFNLYRTDDDQLVVYVANWTYWQGESQTYRLYVITEADLRVGGEYEHLGHACGFGRPLTLDEAIEATD